VRIYSYALTQAEIVEAMNDSGEVPTPTPTPTATSTPTPTATPTPIAPTPTPAIPSYSLTEVMKALLSRELGALPTANELTAAAKSDGFPVQIIEPHKILGYTYQIFGNGAGYRLYYCEILDCVPKWVE